MDFENAEIRELKAAAFETLMFFPGCGYDGWIAVLLKEYTSEVVDALGDDPESVVEELSLWWREEIYTDEITGIAKIYKDWANLFCDQKAVDFYRSLVNEAVKAKEAAENQQ